jgi:hypothetical protein
VREGGGQAGAAVCVTHLAADHRVLEDRVSQVDVDKRGSGDDRVDELCLRCGGGSGGLAWHE